MKISCEVVQDLLALYHDGVCSKDSAQIVKEHLNECEKCRKMLADMDNDMIPDTEEAKPLLSVQISWNKEKRKVFLKGLAIALCLCLLWGIGNHVLTKWYCVPMNKDDLVLMDLYQTSDGVIHFDYNDLYNFNYLSTAGTLGDDGSLYVECYRPILAKKEAEPPKHATAGQSIAPDNNRLGPDDTSVSLDKIYLGVLNQPENSILVWEKGMDVRPATPGEEELYSRRRGAE